MVKTQRQILLDALGEAMTQCNFMLPSRELSMVRTKIDEAVLWAGAIPEDPAAIQGQLFRGEKEP